MIKVTASGNIGQDAEVKQVTNEHSVVNFAIASNKKVKGETRTTWLNCQKWNSDKLAPYLLKGTKVTVSGDLEIRKKDDKYYTTLNVQDLDFGSSPQRQDTQPAYSAEVTQPEPQAADSPDEYPPF